MQIPKTINLVFHQRNQLNNQNTNRSINVIRNNFVSQSGSSVSNCDEVSNILDYEINISSVLKTKHKHTT